MLEIKRGVNRNNRKTIDIKYRIGPMRFVWFLLALYLSALVPENGPFWCVFNALFGRIYIFIWLLIHSAIWFAPLREAIS